MARLVCFQINNVCACVSPAHPASARIGSSPPDEDKWLWKMQGWMVSICLIQQKGLSTYDNTVVGQNET